MKISRRDFLKKGSSVVKGGLFLYTAELLLPRSVLTDTGPQYDWEKLLVRVCGGYQCVYRVRKVC